MIRVANPIYESVFKYLVEDKRIAKILLSSLIRKEVIDIEMRPHEYANTTKDNVSLFCIDFGAKVREADGSEKIILIELQKNWVETETLRFRQYLGVQYANPDNMDPATNNHYAFPTITIYLLGHRVGDIEEPVLYVGRKYTNEKGVEITQGLPNEFVDSLTHESIIVQLPLLKGQKSTRLEKILNVFSQTRKDEENHQALKIDDEMFEEDDEVKQVLTRLLCAASDTEIRMPMNIEEKFCSVLEKRETEILVARNRISQQNQQLAQQQQQLKRIAQMLQTSGKDISAIAGIM